MGKARREATSDRARKAAPGRIIGPAIGAGAKDGANSRSARAATRRKRRALRSGVDEESEVKGDRAETRRGRGQAFGRRASQAAEKSLFETRRRPPAARRKPSRRKAAPKFWREAAVATAKPTPRSLTASTYKSHFISDARTRRCVQSLGSKTDDDFFGTAPRLRAPPRRHGGTMERQGALRQNAAPIVGAKPRPNWNRIYLIESGAPWQVFAPLSPSRHSAGK